MTRRSDKVTERFIEEIKDWFGRRCREAELRGEADEVDREIRQIFKDLEAKLLRRAQEDPRLPSMKVGMTSVGIETGTGEPTHLTVILENGTSVNLRDPFDSYGVIRLDYTPRNPINRWETIGKPKDDKQIPPYAKKHKQKDRKNPRFDKLSRYLSKKLPVEE